jgi:CHAT domain-containing protein/Tfp pilus assembly protein PilF
MPTLFRRRSPLLLVSMSGILIQCSGPPRDGAGPPPPRPGAAPNAGLASVPPAATEAEKYLAEARELARAAQRDRAVASFRRASEIYASAGDWEHHVLCRELMGEQLWKKASYDEALAVLARASETAVEKLGARHARTGGVQHELGNVYLATGKLDQAGKLLAQGLEVRLAALGEQHPDVARSYHSLGNLALQKGDYDEALLLQEKALAIDVAAAGAGSLEAAKSYNNLGNIYAMKGDYQRAIGEYEKSLAIRLRLAGDRHLDTAASYVNLGNVHSLKGDNHEAIGYYEKALSIQLELLGETHPDVARHSYYNMALAYSDAGEYDQALEYLEKTLAIERAGGGEKGPHVGRAYDSIGIVYASRGDYDRALESYQKALSIQLADLGERSFEVSNIYLNQGAAHRKKGDLARARGLYQRALSIRSALVGERSPHVAQIYLEMGDSYAERDLHDKAVSLYQKALQADSRGSIGADVHAPVPVEGVLSEKEFLQALAGKAQSLFERWGGRSRATRDLETAVSTYRLASRLIEQTRRSYRAEGSKLFLAREATRIYERGMAAALELHRVGHDDAMKHLAFEFAEKSKAGIMLESLAESEARRFGGIPDDLLEKERQVRVDLAFYERSLGEEEEGGDRADSRRIAVWRDKVFDLRREYANLVRDLERHYPAYYNLKYATTTASVEEIQERVVADGAALVEYLTGDDAVFIATVTAGAFDIETAARGPSLEQDLEGIRSGITKRDFPLYVRSAHRLYRLLLGPVADRVRGKRLIIVPDAALSGLPFEALLTEEVKDGGGSGEYGGLPFLIREHPVSYAYSASLLLEQLRARVSEAPLDYVGLAPLFADGLQVGTRGAAVFEGNREPPRARGGVASGAAARGYLPASRNEVLGILNRFEGSYDFGERWFGKKARVYLGREAREERVKAGDLGPYRFVHFATHGFLNEGNPKLSGLLLASEGPTSEEDGVLQLGEIYDLELHADLVTLSACETGRGRVAKGEGVIGLTRGFLYSGARNVLVSLWQVSDATTSELMVDFYGAMLGGTRKADALRAAKLALIGRDPESAKPYYWAPFVLIGQ